MRYQLLGVTPSHGQWKWSRDRALRAVNNYEQYLKEAQKANLEEYWQKTGQQLEFIRKSP
jgi:adenine-specific DNA-methyltransferase